MSATATLTNCYVPLPAVSSSSSSTADDYDPYARPNTDNQHHGDTSLTTTHQTKNNPSQQQHTTATSTTRGPRTLRQLHLAKSILSQSTGSALVEWGHTKVMVSVRGPRPNNCSSMNNTNNNSILSCEVRYMSNVGIRMETLARHSLANDFSSNSGSIGGGGGGGAKIPRDSIGTANDTSNLLSGISAPAAFLDETYLSKRLYEAILPSVIVNEELMKSNKMCIEVFVQIL
ncbi:hypothetical protein ACHAWC_001174, partial [Mediolabrus comicus]